MALDSKVRDALKDYFSKDYDNSLAYKDRPALALIKKDEKFAGDSFVVPLAITASQGRSATFASAQSAQSAGRVKKFRVPTVQNFQNAYINDEDILASKNKGEGAFFDLLTQNMETAQDNLMRDLNIDLYRDASGARGQVASLSGQTFKPKNLNDLVNFEQDMVLVASDTTTGALRSGTATITNIQPDGTITYSGTITSLANNDYLFVKGDAADNGGTPLKMYGFASYGPSSISTSDSFCGTNRSVDARRMAMQYIDFTSEGLLSPQDTISKMAFKAFQIGGGRPDTLLCNSSFMQSLLNDLGSKIVYCDVKSDDVANVLFKGVRVVTPHGTIEVMEDRDCPSTDLVLLQRADWTIFSRGTIAGLNDIDGLEFLRAATAPAEEIRFNFYGNLVSKAPGRSCRAKIA